MHEPVTGVRLDKWLWAARFFKTRALAATAISGGKVHVNGQRAKASKEVHVGASLQISIGEDVFDIVVRGLSDRRGPATVAQQLYEETAASRERRAQRAELRRQHAIIHPDRHGRPTKRERRAIVRFTRRGRDDPD
jgi:ribosome-associated heat shock protein Hsp15